MREYLSFIYPGKRYVFLSYQILRITVYCGINWYMKEILSLIKSNGCRMVSVNNFNAHFIMLITYMDSKCQLTTFELLIAVVIWEMQASLKLF